MLKKIVALVSVTFLGFSLSLLGDLVLVAQAQTTATLSLSPTTSTVVLNQTFNVTVNMNTAGAPVDGVDLYMVRFNPAILQVVDSDGVAAGVQIAPGTLLANTIVNTVDNVAGTIQFSQATAGGTSFTGSGVLATITFKGIAGGTSNVTFDFNLGSTADTNVAYQGADRLNTVTNGSYTVDTTAPTAPAGLTATVVSVSQINLTWTASTDNVAVTGYQVERCTGAACATFALIASPAGTSQSDSGLAGATTYRYRVRATDAAANLSAYSAIVNATTLSAFDFTLSNGGNKSVTQSSSVTNVVTATLSTGTTQAVTFAASGMPAGVTAGFVPTSCSPTCTSTLTLTASAAATVGTSTITVTGTAGALSRTTTFTLTVSSSTFQRTINIASLEALSTRTVTGTLNVLNTSRVLLKSYAFTTDSTGNAVINFDIPAQTVFLQVKAAPYLTRLISQDLNVVSTYIFPQLLTGDINQDNIINSIDYSSLNTNWFTTNATGDLNKDGLVNSIDYSYMNKHWLVSGEI